jgi:glutamate dehydrogenase (NAD(P)+)
MGGWFVIREAARDNSLDLRGARVAIQGFGNVGAPAALIGQEQFGCRIVAVSDSSGGIFAEDGLAVRALVSHKKKSGRVHDFPGARNITNNDLLELECDILIPAALENVITMANAGKVAAKMVAEFANGPVGTGADEILHGNGIPVIPDFLCNGGGVIVSYFEMVQNANFDHWDEKEVFRRLEKKMIEAYRSVRVLSSQNQVPMRQAAYSIAVSRVVQGMDLRRHGGRVVDAPPRHRWEIGYYIETFRTQNGI